MCRYIWWTTGRKGNDSVFQHNNCLILAHQPWKTDTRKKWRNPGQQLAQWMTSRHHFPNTNSYSSLATFRTENWSYIAREKICRSHNSKRYETCTEAWLGGLGRVFLSWQSFPVSASWVLKSQRIRLSLRSALLVYWACRMFNKFRN